MYAVRSDTLAGIKTSALFQKRDMSGVYLPQWVKALNAYQAGNPGVKSPDGEAVKFYFSNHVFTLIQAKFDEHELLPPEYLELARDYVKMSSALVQRLAYYTLIITTREMRHCHGSLSHLTKISSGKFSLPVVTFLHSLTKAGEDGALGMLKDNPVDRSIVEYCAAMDHLFEFGGFHHQFGNKPWAVVAETLRKFTDGTITAEMFADTAFTLCHNNGPIFNKGHLYSMYNKAFIYRMLDVQRSGQIPQFLSSGHVPPQMLDKEFIDYSTKAVKVFAKELGGYVDWFKVEALGALHKYPKEQADQLAIHGPSPYQGKGKMLNNNVLYFVAPNISVQAYKRKKPKMKKVA